VGKGFKDPLPSLLTINIPLNLFGTPPFLGEKGVAISPSFSDELYKDTVQSKNINRLIGLGIGLGVGFD